MKKNLVFDLDGTLIESAPDIHNATNKVLANLNLAPLSMETVIGFIGNGVPKLVECMMAEVGIAFTNKRHSELVGMFSAYYAINPATLSYLNKGVQKSLTELQKAGHKMAVCTNKPYDLTLQVLSCLDIEQYFDVVIGGDSLAVKKPDPAPLQKAIELLGGKVCVYIGDSEVDAQTAQNAGQPFYLFTDGYRKKSAKQISPDAAFDDFAMLQNLIENTDT